jgi:hypothetical protein
MNSKLNLTRYFYHFRWTSRQRQHYSFDNRAIHCFQLVQHISSAAINPWWIGEFLVVPFLNVSNSYQQRNYDPKDRMRKEIDSCLPVDLCSKSRCIMVCLPFQKTRPRFSLPSFSTCCTSTMIITWIRGNQILHRSYVLPMFVNTGVRSQLLAPNYGQILIPAVISWSKQTPILIWLTDLRSVSENPRRFTFENFHWFMRCV